MEALSKRDVLLLFSVLEGELEARDFVIQALKVSADVERFCSFFVCRNLWQYGQIVLLSLLKGTVHPTTKALSLFTQPCAISYVCGIFGESSYSS